MENLQVANTILDQLGGRRFIAMTGARNLLGSANSLSFKLPSGFALHGINYVKITLNESDLYDVEFGTIRGRNYKKSSDYVLYAEDLQRIFREETGLDTHL